MYSQWQRWSGMVLGGGLSLLLAACSGPATEVGSSFCSPSEPDLPLCAPKSSLPQVVAAMDLGNRFFAVGRYESARQQYKEALTLQPNVPEVHYNLAMALQHLGKRKQMHKHFIEAANLAPGHKKIWDSTALRRYGNVPDKPVTATLPALPGIGGLGGGGVGGNRGY